ncbi:MAG: oligoribonuclease [Methylacidiphilales bacterium]|nr:oligoribonuclease [Candidatus Methylacidiphilales bacterium]
MLISKDNLIWVDLEMTGLNPDTDLILEIATIVTDKNIEELVIGPHFTIHQPINVLDSMDNWNRLHHGKSGLIKDVLGSSITVEMAEQITIKFLSKYCYPGESPMCGNSICQDRRFMARLMPNLEQFFHYRNLDVSTLKILVNRWLPDRAMKRDKKKSAHRALDDIKDSIKEIKYYKSIIFENR